MAVATVKRLTWMLLSFVLGATWFLLIATALATGVGLAVTLLGFPILIGTLYLLRPMARLERALVRSLLGAEIAGAYRRAAHAGWWPAVQTRLGDPQTWKDLAYLLVQLPLGIVWLVLAIADVVLLGLAAVGALLLWPWRRAVFGAALSLIEYEARAPIAWSRLALESTPDPELAEARSTQQRIVEAADDARRRIERDLHDGAQQRLVALSLKLGMARARVDGAAGELVAEAHEESKLALAELRDLARGIHPAVLTERGLAAALDDLAARSTVPVTVEVAPDERLPAPVEATAYFVVAECLSNVAKYAEARSAWIAAWRVDGTLHVQVRDDGRGGADPSTGSGLRGLTDRVRALDGHVWVESPPGLGTRISATVPLRPGE